MAELNKRQHDQLAGVLAYVRGQLRDAAHNLDNQGEIITEAREELRPLFHELTGLLERVDKLCEAHHEASAALHRG